MKYSTQDLGFILYNNRSVNGVVKNFLDKDMDPYQIIQIEDKFDWCKSIFEFSEKFVEIDLSKLNPDADDEVITKDQLSELTETIVKSVGIFNEAEYIFLNDRKISQNQINDWSILGLSSIKDKESLRRLGATCHPVLSGFLKDGIDEGGIMFPLFENEILTNCSIRRINDVGKLKYTLAVPDTPVWGLEDVENGIDELWICEGIFDMISLRDIGLKACTPSSAMWSGIQLYKLISKNPKKIMIFADNDRVGLKTAAVLNKFFNLCKINSEIYRSNKFKDANEHITQNGLGQEEFEKINVTKEMILNKDDNSFNFLKYLQNRKF